MGQWKHATRYCLLHGAKADGVGGWTPRSDGDRPADGTLARPRARRRNLSHCYVLIQNLCNCSIELHAMLWAQASAELNVLMLNWAKGYDGVWWSIELRGSFRPIVHVTHHKKKTIFLFALNQKKIYRPSRASFFQKSWTISRNGTV